MTSDSALDDPLLKLSDTLGELEMIIGDKARPVVAEVRARLLEAVASRRDRGPAVTLEVIHRAMETLAALAAQLDPAEGLAMRAIAERFTHALAAGDKGTAKKVVNLMRHRAGDPRDDENPQW